MRMVFVIGVLVMCCAAMSAVVPKAGGGWQTQGLPYAATITAKGVVDSFTIGGTNLLAAPGLFLSDGEAALATTVAVDGETVTLDGGAARLVMRFLPEGIDCALYNRTVASGYCTSMLVSTGIARVKNPESGIEMSLPPKLTFGKMRLLVPGGGSLTVPDGYIQPRDGAYMVRFPWANPGKFPAKFLLAVSPTLLVDDALTVAVKTPAEDHVYWKGDPQPLTTDLTNMLPNQAFRGRMVLKVQSFLTRAYVQEQSQPVTLGAGATKALTWTLQGLEPGFYFTEIWAERGKARGMCCRARFLFNAAALAPPPPPDDFAAFWQRTLDEQAKVPLDLQITKDRELDKFVVYKFNFAGLLKRRIYGYLSVPKDTSKRHPAVLVLPSAGEHRIAIPQFTDTKGNPVVAMAISVTNQDVDLPDDAYDWATWPAPYLVTGIYDKDRYALRFAYAGVARAAEVLAARPEVLADDVLCYGSSQGGGLTFIAAGLYPKFKAAVINCPALCRLDWLFEYLDAPFFPIASDKASRLYILETLRYFDASQFARSITCPTWVNIGLMDDGVPAMSVMCAYNVIPAKQKTLLVLPQMGHAGVYSPATAAGVWP